MISDDILCQNFKAYMLLERGYSENTRIAYLSDLVRLHQWLAEGGYTLTMATPEVLADFVFQIHDIGVSQRTQARIVAGGCFFYTPYAGGGLSRLGVCVRWRCSRWHEDF